MKKLFAILLACLVLTLCAVAETDNSLADIQAKGTLILGLDDTFAPMGFRDENGEVVGFDIDLAKAVCEKLGVTLVIQPIDWDMKEMELSSGNIDCIWNGMSATAERQESMSLTIPYMNNAMALVSGDETCITTEGMAGKVLGVQAGSYAEEMLSDPAFADFKASLKDTIAFAEYATAFMDLTNGGLDAILVDSVYASYTTANLSGTYFIGEGLEDDLYAVGFRKSDVALRDAVDEILAGFKADGTMSTICLSWMAEDLVYIPAE